MHTSLDDVEPKRTSALRAHTQQHQRPLGGHPHTYYTHTCTACKCTAVSKTQALLRIEAPHRHSCPAAPKQSARSGPLKGLLPAWACGCGFGFFFQIELQRQHVAVLLMRSRSEDHITIAPSVRACMCVAARREHVVCVSCAPPGQPGGRRGVGRCLARGRGLARAVFPAWKMERAPAL